MSELTHFDEKGRSRMVEVTKKPVTSRMALARGFISMKPETFERILRKDMAKGDVFEVARIAAIMGAKQTAGLIPLCHPTSITSIEISFYPIQEKYMIQIEAMVKAVDRTGVEMEALTAVSIAALTVYDMCKSIDRGMTIDYIQLIEKSGGKSGLYKRQDRDEKAEVKKREKGEDRAY